MKMKRNLIILGIVAVLAVALVLVAPKLKPGASPTATPEPTTDPALLSFVSTTADKISEVTVQNDGGTYTVYMKDKKYYIKGQESVDVDQASAGALFNQGVTISGERLIEQNAKDLSQYGLDKPQATVTVKYTDGTSGAYLLGAATSGGDAYYLMKQGDARVVTIGSSFGSTYKMTVGSMLTKEAYTLTQDETETAKVLEKGKEALELTTKDVASSVSITNWMIVYPWRRSVDSTQLDTYLKAVYAVTMGDVADPAPKDLSKYGLDNPAYDITLSGKGKTSELLIGNAVDDTYTYAMFAGGKYVYKVTTDSLSFMKTTAYVLMDKTILLVNITSTIGLEFKGLGADGKLNIEQVQQTDDTGAVKKDSNGNPVYDQKFTVDGKSIDDKVARYFYQTCIGLATHSLVAEGWQPKGDPIAVLTYTRTTDPKTITIEFLPYDSDFYAVRIDGQTNFLITQDKVQTVADDLNKLKAGTLTVPQS